MATKATSIRFTSFPRTKAPPAFAREIVTVFELFESEISTINLSKGLESDDVLKRVAPELDRMGFQIESSKASHAKIARPVFYGENGIPTLRYEIDGYHASWKCGIEIEAGRAILGNAIFRDLFQAMVMVDVDVLCLAVPNSYKYKSSGKSVASAYYDKTISVADALYSHSRVQMPYGLIVIGY